MLHDADLKSKLSRSEYLATIKTLQAELGELQREIREAGIPVGVVLEGWNASGKGTLINKLLLALDSRGVAVHKNSRDTPSEEGMRPYLWRFWVKTPPRGRITLFDRSWYRRVQTDRADNVLTPIAWADACRDILSFERTLTDDGAVLVKFFLHISAREQKKRFRHLQQNPATSWRVTEEDWRENSRYKLLLAVSNDLIAQTHTDSAPWTVIPAHDERLATVTAFQTLIAALRKRLAQARTHHLPTPVVLPPLPPESLLDQVDVALDLRKDIYRAELKIYQERMRELEHEIYVRRIPVVIVYEGWDAAGKGGNIRRLIERMDPRGYEVIPVAAPNDLEKSHHYLWRFWTNMPRSGHIAIFDRSWYGRVLVERVEGFCTEADWQRAYREINEMEEQLHHFGAIVLKFWLHISKEEQLRRFEARQNDPAKQWKITPEDWRNREKWDQTKIAVEEMLHRTHTPHAPWTIVESESKRHARIKVLRTVVSHIEHRIGQLPP